MLYRSLVCLLACLLSGLALADNSRPGSCSKPCSAAVGNQSRYGWYGAECHFRGHYDRQLSRCLCDHVDGTLDSSPSRGACCEPYSGDFCNIEPWQRQGGVVLYGFLLLLVRQILSLRYGTLN